MQKFEVSLKFYSGLVHSSGEFDRGGPNLKAFLSFYDRLSLSCLATFSDFDINVNWAVLSCTWHDMTLTTIFKKNGLFLVLVLILFLFSSNIMKRVNCVECISWMGLMHHDTTLYLHQPYHIVTIPCWYSTILIQYHADSVPYWHKTWY